MFSYDRFYRSQGIDLAKSNNSILYIFCNYWDFNNGFEFQHSICNSCRYLTMLGVNISDIVVITIKSVDYCCFINSISKYEAFNVLENSVTAYI